MRGYLLTGINIVHGLNFLPRPGEGIWGFLCLCPNVEQQRNWEGYNLKAVSDQTSKMGSDCESISWMKYHLMMEINLFFV